MLEYGLSVPACLTEGTVAIALWICGWMGWNMGSGVIKYFLFFMSLQLCVSGCKKALSFHVDTSLSKVKSGFASQAEQIADRSHL